MSFSPVKNVRIMSLTEGAVVQLRFGKAAVRSDDDKIFEAKLDRKYTENEKDIVVFKETDGDGNETETRISRFPGAAWRSENAYVSLVAVDESTFTVAKPATPIATDVIADAIKLVEAAADDVFGAEQLVALLTEVQTGKRINTGIKDLATKLAHKLIEELSSEPDDAETGTEATAEVSA